MRPMNKITSPLDIVISRVGSQALLAKHLGVAPPSICDWKKTGQIPAARVLQVEKISGVSRHVLRPDIYPTEVA